MAGELGLQQAADTVAYVRNSLDATEALSLLMNGVSSMEELKSAVTKHPIMLDPQFIKQISEMARLVTHEEFPLTYEGWRLIVDGLTAIKQAADQAFDALLSCSSPTDIKMASAVHPIMRELLFINAFRRFIVKLPKEHPDLIALEQRILVVEKLASSD